MIRPLIAGNWKMYKTPQEAENFALELKRIHNYDDRDILVCPPFPAIACVSRILADTGIYVGAQNVYPAKEGAFTGEVSPLMLKDAGAQFVICGHSERRQIFKETDDFVSAKVKAVIEYDMTPILCVGETLQQNERGETFSVVKRQIMEGLKNVSGDKIKKIVIAYEPVWAIGTGRNATPQQANEVHAFIRDLIQQIYGDLALSVRILYGGSVKPENIDSLMAEKDINGVLVGGASLRFESFSRIAGFNKND
ncbi:MAG: triose-phosphate isomerase [Candidatus Omnitrophica bacterium]|nr:triose-phosphate isomerase [Candidatus Omnitrophota bacterium]MCM8789021.1 triose-phosphate isomerase [Candidatus Omnitrophota bacterium]